MFVKILEQNYKPIFYHIYIKLYVAHNIRCHTRKTDRKSHHIFVRLMKTFFAFLLRVDVGLKLLRIFFLYTKNEIIGFTNVENLYRNVFIG